MFGLLGLSLFSIYYVFLLKIVHKLVGNLKLFFRSGRYNTRPFIYLLTILLIAQIYYKFTFGIMGLFGEIIQGTARTTDAITIGFLIASLEILKSLNFTDYARREQSP